VLAHDDIGASVHKKTESGNTPLLPAAGKGLIANAAALCDRNDIDLAPRANDNMTALDYAIDKNHPTIADLLRRTQARHDIRTRIVRFLALRARLAAMAAAADDESATTGAPVADMPNNQLRAALNEHGVRYGRMKRRAMMDTLEPLEASPSGRVRISRKLRVPAEVLEAEVGVGLVAFDPRLVRDVVPLIMQFAGRASSEDPPLERVCACCGAEGELVACAGCYQQWYCGPECQKARWKSSHKKLCGWFVEKYGGG
jgi:hypothetical protein